MWVYDQSSLTYKNLPYTHVVGNPLYIALNGKQMEVAKAHGYIPITGSKAFDTGPVPPPVNLPDSNYDIDGEDEQPSMKAENTFVILKPDAFERGLVGELMNLIDKRGLKMLAAKTVTMTKAQVADHYSHHLGKNFFPELQDYLTSGPSVCIVYRGPQASGAVRQLIGNKHPCDSQPGTIRGTYATSFPKNLIHGADSPSDAKVEMARFFNATEIKEINKEAKLVDELLAA